MNYKIIGIISFFLILFYLGFTYNNFFNLKGKFIINDSNFYDVIEFRKNGSYMRNYRNDEMLVVNYGKWYFKNNHLYLSNWSDPNNYLPVQIEKPITIAVVCKRNLLGKPIRIYIDHTKMKYFRKI